MADLPASHDLAPSARGSGWRRGVFAALPALLYAGLVVAVFGGLAIDRLPDSLLARIGMVTGGAVVVVLAALWLGRRERVGEAEAAEPGD